MPEDMNNECPSCAEQPAAMATVAGHTMRSEYIEMPPEISTADDISKAQRDYADWLALLGPGAASATGLTGAATGKVAGLELLVNEPARRDLPRSEIPAKQGWKSYLDSSAGTQNVLLGHVRPDNLGGVSLHEFGLVHASCWREGLDRNGGGLDLLAEETIGQRLKRKIKEWDDALEYYFKRYTECKATCDARHKQGTADHYQCVTDCYAAWGVLVVWARKKKTEAEDKLARTPQGKQNDPAGEETVTDKTEWQKWGAEVLEHFKRGLNSLDEDDVNGFAKGTLKDVLTDKAKEKIKDKTGYDPDSKPACLLAGMMLVGQALKSGYASLPPAQAAAQAFADLRNDPDYKLAHAACITTKGAFSTDPIKVCEGWLEWAQSQ